MKKQLLAGLAFLGAIASAPAAATVSIGDTVTCGALGGLECSSFTQTVGNTAEFGIDAGMLGTLLTADFSAGLLTIAHADNSDAAGEIFFNGPFDLFFSNITSPFTFAQVGAISGVTNFGSSNVSLGDTGFLTVNLTGVRFQPNASVQVRLDPTAPLPAVPEPATWAMMMLGFGVVGYAMRRRSTATVRVARA